MPEQPATGDQSGESQEQDQADRDSDGQRHDVAGHRQRDHRQHQADHDPLARRQPWRPTSRQAQTEDQAARNQR
jgi:hypothetical protein